MESKYLQRFQYVAREGVNDGWMDNDLNEHHVFQLGDNVETRDWCLARYVPIVLSPTQMVLIEKLNDDPCYPRCFQPTLVPPNPAAWRWDLYKPSLNFCSSTHQVMKIGDSVWLTTEEYEKDAQRLRKVAILHMPTPLSLANAVAFFLFPIIAIGK